MANVTIKDIARKIGIHHSTVSRALRNHPDISRETREKVLAVAEELDYHPNALARDFKVRRSRTIGVIVPTIKNDFFSTVISGIESVTYDLGYNIILCQSDENYQRELLNVRTLISNVVAGIIIAVSQTTQTTDHLKKLKQRGIHLVFFDRVPTDIQASRVVVNDFEGAFRLIEHLIDSGCRRIAHLAGPEYISVSRDRCRGFVAALEKHGMSAIPGRIVYGGFMEDSGSRGVNELYDGAEGPDGIFCVNDRVALGAYVTLKERGIRIPDEVALTGFSNNPMTALLDPPLTTVDQQPYEMGKIAARMILNQIERGTEKMLVEKTVLQTELIIRESSCRQIPNRRQDR